MANKFFNMDINQTDDDDDELETEYSDKIHVFRSKASDEYIDKNNKVMRVFLIALGIFCIIGVSYYVLSWLFTK